MPYVVGVRQVDEIPGVRARATRLRLPVVTGTFRQKGPCQVGKMHQAVQVVHGALEIGQHCTHFLGSITQVFGHHFVGIADPVYKTVIVALNLLEYIQ